MAYALIVKALCRPIFANPKFTIASPKREESLYSDKKLSNVPPAESNKKDQ